MKNFLAGFLVGNCAPLDLALKPLLSFGFRFYVAYVFFMSGLSKVDSNFQITSTTIDLFKYEYSVPLLPAELAAYLATYAELILPILLVLGIFTRPAALALFVLNAVAAYALSQTDFASAAGHWQHILWGAMLAVIFTFGPGKISIDNWISRKLLGKETNVVVTLVSLIVLNGLGYLVISGLTSKALLLLSTIIAN